MHSTCVIAVHVLNTQLISVFNFILTVGGSFVFAYKATEYALDTPNYALVCWTWTWTCVRCISKVK